MSKKKQFKNIITKFSENFTVVPIVVRDFQIRLKFYLDKTIKIVNSTQVFIFLKSIYNHQGFCTSHPGSWKCGNLSLIIK